MLTRPVLSMLSPSGLGARLSVLIFHRVLRAPDSLFPDEVDARRFDEICSWIARWLHVLPLDAAVQRLEAGTLPSRAAAITFDDGYRDNREVALPILQRHGLCATFFIATGFLDGGCMWNDVVIESLRRADGVALDLRELQIPGLERFDISGVPARRTAIDRILGALKYRPLDDRVAAAQKIAAIARVAIPDDTMMSSRHVLEMHRAGMQIGAHTVSHPILAKLERAAARREMLDSKRFLERLLEQPVPLFAYPNGKPNTDFTAESAILAREVGFEAAVTTAPGAASMATDRFDIPRFTPWDRTAWRFGARLASNLRVGTAPAT